MGFDYNPYHHIELIQCKDDSAYYFLYCHNCGMDSERKGNERANNLPTLLANWKWHLKLSHKVTESFFKDWTDF